MTHPTSSASPEVRSQLVTAFELDLIGPTQRVLQALGADAAALERETLDRLPSSWYPTGCLVPTETSPELHELRQLHGEMDLAMLHAYGWGDGPTLGPTGPSDNSPSHCGFDLDDLDTADDA